MQTQTNIQGVSGDKQVKNFIAFVLVLNDNKVECNLKWKILKSLSIPLKIKFAHQK